MRRSSNIATLLAGATLLATPAYADPAPATPAASLEAQFHDPPAAARPRVWWHWMNGNITKDGIAKDLAWMHAVGIGGVQAFDANLSTPQIVPHRLAYMTPEWKDAFKFAVSEAEHYGMEFGIASSPGWSETGGPWVPPEDGLKKLVWSSGIALPPGRRLTVPLPLPPSVAGPFGALPKQPSIDEMLSGKPPVPGPVRYGDIAVLAVPERVLPEEWDWGIPSDGLGHTFRPQDLWDPAGTGVDLTRSADGSAMLEYNEGSTTRTIRSASLFIPGAAGMFMGPSFTARIETSDDGKAWRKIADVPLADVPTTLSFAPVTAAHFRLVLAPQSFAMANLGPGGDNGVAAPPMFAPKPGAGAQPIHVAQFTLSGGAVVDQFERKAGFAIAQDYYALADPGDGAKGADPAQTLDITSHLRADGVLDWTPPPLPGGEHWRVIRLGWSLLGTTNHPATAEATGLEVDKYDAAAVHRYMEHYLGMYRDAVGPALIGKAGIRAFLTDSIEVGAANWTPTLIAEFKARRGYDPTPYLPALAGVLVGSRADSDRFLYDYRRTIADLMAEAHYGTVANDAHAAGMTVYGEAHEDHRPSLGDDMSMRSHTDVAMSAMWTYPIGGTPRATYLADTKGAASVAHVYGQKFVAAESMTSMMTPWADSPRTLKHVIDLEFLQGINRPVIHESTHQPVDDKVPGLSLSIFGQYFNRHDAWAPLAKPWVDYISRNAFMLQQGHDAADVGYFYGEEAPLTGLYGDTPVADAPTTHAYDFISADALRDALSNDGGDVVTRGGARYKALYLGGSSRRMTLPTLRRFVALVEAGATLVGMPPQGSPSEADATPPAQAEYAALLAKLWPAGGARAGTNVGKGHVIASNDIEVALGNPDFVAPGVANIGFVHRHLDDGEDYFLVNRGEQTAAFTGLFRVTGKAPELWHAEDGSIVPTGYAIANGRTAVPFSLAPEESVHVVFRKPATSDGMDVPAFGVPRHFLDLAGPWQVAFQPGRGAPPQVTLTADAKGQLPALNDNAEPGIRYFSGIATYSHAFTVSAGKSPAHLWLDLGEVREVAQVAVNGVDVGSVWHMPYRLDIARALHPGQNQLSIRVANLWVNRLIGDAQPGVTTKITWTALPTYRADAKLRLSGLIGPVTLSVER